MIRNISPHLPKSKRHYEFMTKLPLLNEHIRTIYYNWDQNYFYDEFGWTVYNIYTLVTPAQVMLFKQRGTGVIRKIYPDITNSFLVELVWE